VNPVPKPPLAGPGVPLARRIQAQMAVRPAREFKPAAAGRPDNAYTLGGHGTCPLLTGLV